MNILARFCDKRNTRDIQREGWLSDLNQVKSELDSNEMLFNMTDDFNLTEYAIHRKAALEARYSYLMRLIKRYDEACGIANKQEMCVTDNALLVGAQGNESSENNDIQR